jgi:serine/threonine protein kinase
LFPQDAADEHQTHERTARELLCLLLLNHPNIIKVLAHGQWPEHDRGHLYLVLEYVEGWTLAEWIERMHPTAQEIIRVFERIAAALAYMHELELFHRDLKLANVVIRKSNGSPVLIDFGAAYFAQAPELTEAGLPPGTPRYRSPGANRFVYENRKNPKARYHFQVADELFAFGVMLYDALTDPRPWEQRVRTNVNTVLVGPTPPEIRNPRIPAALASLVRRLMARVPAQRPESAEMVRRELEELLEHQGAEYRVPVHPPSSQVVEPPAPKQAHLKGARALRALGLGRGLRWAVELVGMLGVVAVAAALLVRSSPSVGSSPSQKEGATMTTPQSELSVCATQPKPPPSSSKEQFFKWCQSAGVVGTALAFCAGCPGAQLRPDPEDCPSAVVAEMEANGLHIGDVVFVNFEPFSDDSPRSIPLSSGKLKVMVRRGWTEEIEKSLPPGTIAWGQVWMTPGIKHDQAIMRLERVRTPSGREFPVCLRGSSSDREDSAMNTVGEGPQPGTRNVHNGNVQARVVARWPDFK